MPKTLVTEAVEAAGTATSKGSGVFLIDLITPGWGSSGYYSPAVLEQAAKDKIFPAGTQMFINHQTAQERNDRPEGDLRDLAAVLKEDAIWTGKSLQAKADVFETWRAPLEAMKDSIGASIRASADIEFGEAEGRNGRIIERLVHAQSVDFVTQAGRGGRIVEVLESKRAAGRAIGRGLEEATANQLAELLRDALKETYGADKTYVWVRDYDQTTVWFERESPDSTELLQQEFSLSEDGALALTGEPVEVRQVITYVPVHPAGQSITTTESAKEDNMGTIQVEESVHADLLEKAGRVTALEAERDTAIAERDAARKETADSRTEVRESKVARIIAEADVDFTALEATGLQALAEKHTAEGVLDEDKFKTAVDEAAATKKVAEGAGRVRDNGQRGEVEDTVSEADLDELDDAVFGKVKEA